MKKLFISQPMKGKTDEMILAEREAAVEAAQSVLGEEVEVIENFFSTAPEDESPLRLLGESIKALAEADVAFFAKGWRYGRGCRIEHACAVAYEIDVIEA